MSLPLLLGLLLSLAALLVGGAYVWRRTQTRAHRMAKARRLVETYEVLSSEDLEDAEDALPLCNPEGLISIRTDGLGLYFGRPPGTLRHVPWGRVKSVEPIASGRFLVDVSRVGPVEIPGVVGRKLWEVFGRSASVPSSRPVERARSARV